MKKQAYTLAEVLVTFGIIGVIAAILLPAINNMMPDENKVMYLKTYDTLSEMIVNLASSSQIYPACDSTNNINCSTNPLLNTNIPMVAPFAGNDRYSGSVKLCNLIAYGMGVADADVSCSAGSYDYTDNTFKNNLSFTTKNGMQWKVVQQFYQVSGGLAQFQTDIYVDINGNKGSNCMYSDVCQKPDIFKFMVAANGKVVSADPMGRNYVVTRKSLQKKNYSISDATILTDLNDYKEGLRSFAYSACSAAVGG